MADVVWQDDVVRRRVERFASSVELSEQGIEKLAPRAPRPVEHQHRIRDVTGGVATWFAECQVMELEDREGFAVGEMKVRDGEGGGVTLGLDGGRQEQRDEDGRQTAHGASSRGSALSGSARGGSNAPPRYKPAPEP